MTPGSSPAACQAVINGASTQIQLTSNLYQIETFMTQTAYKDVGKENIAIIAGMSYIINSWNTKTLNAQIPYKPFEFDINLGTLSKAGGIKFKHEF